ncbi:hypothetical protein BY458DRAFT_492347 [Sporodiniella umbellata]|nr:hypothetical protein BY458DRAFT_492347 [Sporodiniella umbellata]
MLHEDDDPLSNSLFESTSSHFLENTMSTTMFSSHYEEDPWGSSFAAPSHVSGISRSFTAPSFAPSQPVYTTSDVADKAPLTEKKVEYTTSTILNGIRLPAIYDSLYSKYQRSNQVSLTALNNVISKGKISASQIEKIMRIIIPNGVSYVTQSEFNTAIALLACAQNKLDLPEPSILIENEQTKPTGLINPAYPGMVKESNKKKDDKSSLDTQRWFENVEEITITVAPEREGFFFKHVNYIVTSEKRSSIVLRRYSDFWWLWEVLLKRYPFRALPGLPPKKLGGRDTVFLEKRRKGLSRFLNAVIRHPVLRQDEVVSKFLTEPSELSNWRKQNPPNLDEEFKRKRSQYSVEQLLAIIPKSLDEQLEKTRKRISMAISHYINLSLIMERLIRRMHSQAADFSRYSIALNSLAEAELRYHAGECVNCQCVVKGYESVAKHMQSESNILESQVGNAMDGVLENLKSFRDLLASYRDMEERKDKTPSSQVDVIKKRVSVNRVKISQNKSISGLESETERLGELLRADEIELSLQQDRHVFIRYCMWSEMIFIHKQQASISVLYQNYAKDAIHFSKSSVRNWQELEDSVLDMPTDIRLFE